MVILLSVRAAGSRCQAQNIASRGADITIPSQHIRNFIDNYFSFTRRKENCLEYSVSVWSTLCSFISFGPRAEGAEYSSPRTTTTRSSRAHLTPAKIVILLFRSTTSGPTTFLLAARAALNSIYYCYWHLQNNCSGSSAQVLLLPLTKKLPVSASTTISMIISSPLCKPICEVTTTRQSSGFLACGNLALLDSLYEVRSRNADAIRLETEHGENIIKSNPLLLHNCQTHEYHCTYSIIMRPLDPYHFKPRQHFNT